MNEQTKDWEWNENAGMWTEKFHFILLLLLMFIVYDSINAAKFVNIILFSFQWKLKQFSSNGCVLFFIIILLQRDVKTEYCLCM